MRRRRKRWIRRAGKPRRTRRKRARMARRMEDRVDEEDEDKKDREGKEVWLRVSGDRRGRTRRHKAKYPEEPQYANQEQHKSSK